MEDPGKVQSTMPNYGSVAWTSASSNVGNLISPMTAVIQDVQWSSGVNHNGLDEISYDQYVIGRNQFSVSSWGYNG